MNAAYNVDCMEGLKDVPDKYFDLAVVDPVYGDVTKGGYMTNTESVARLAKATIYHNGIWNQTKTGREYFDELFRVSKNQVIWGGNYFSEEIRRNSQCWLVWDKENGDTKYADCELAWTSFNSAVRVFRFKWQGMLQGDMAHKEGKIHPTQKPVALYTWIYNRYAKPGDKILDTHLGSGSSRIAAYDLGLDFTGYEIDKVYFDLQEERFRNHTAQMNLFIE